jgi:hypothetical protein
MKIAFPIAEILPLHAPSNFRGNSILQLYQRRQNCYIQFLIVLSICLASANELNAQFPAHIDTSAPHRLRLVRDGITQLYLYDDSLYIIVGPCKNNRGTIRANLGFSDFSASRIQPIIVKRVPFLKISGNIQYDFLHRSYIDTPFSQREFQQHTLQATLQVIVKDKYPIRVNFSTRLNNSSYFSDLFDIGLQFNRQMFLNKMRENIQSRIPGWIDRTVLLNLESKLSQKRLEVRSLLEKLNDPGRLQDIIEEKEQRLAQLYRSGTDSASGLVKIDTAYINNNNARKSLNDVASNLEKAERELKEYEDKVSKMRRTIQDSVKKLQQAIGRIKDPSALQNFLQKNGKDIGELPKGWKLISSIQQIGIGRSWIDYSELTVKNISLTGLNVEANPSPWYFALGAGRVNYRFRDFVIKNNDNAKQFLYLIRVGYGKKDGNNFILTYYDGKKNSLNSFGNTTVTVPLQRVIGISAESQFCINENNTVVLEVARSSFRVPPGQENKSLMSMIWDLKNRENEAYSVKVTSYFPESQTRTSGYYRKMGANFQSFNLQPANVGQEAYQLKIQQSFWKRKLLVEAGVRKNDFNNPYLAPGVSSKTVFKTLQATLRIRKLPFVTVGYFPSSQLIVANNQSLMETQFNTLNALVSHSYSIGKTRMNSSLNYLKYFNKGVDTGFLYYNASNWIVNHYIFLEKVQLQSSATWSTQKNSEWLILEQGMNVQCGNWLTVNASVKYNKLNHSTELWGGSGGLGLNIQKIGTVQMSYDKSFLPAPQGNLLPVDMGRVTYSRNF